MVLCFERNNPYNLINGQQKVRIHCTQYNTSLDRFSSRLYTRPANILLCCAYIPIPPWWARRVPSRERRVHKTPKMTRSKRMSQALKVT